MSTLEATSLWGGEIRINKNLFGFYHPQSKPNENRNPTEKIYVETFQ